MLATIKDLYKDTALVSIEDMIHIDVDKQDYYDVAFQARVKAVLKTLPIAKWLSIILMILGPLLILATAGVSVVHVWEVISAIAPKDITALVLQPDVIHSAALAFTVVFDVALVYFLFVNLLSTISGTSKVNVYPSMAMVGVLNALYIFKYFPGIHDGFRAFSVGTLTYIAVFLIPIVFFVTIYKTEKSAEYCLAAFYALSIKQETLAAVLNTALVSGGTNAEQISTSEKEERLIKALYDSGVKVTALAKMLGGNYQKQLNHIKNLVEPAQNTLELSQNTLEQSEN